MSKASKARAHDRRMRLKRAAKAAKRALYASLRGTSKKSKKMKVRSRSGSTAGKHQHFIEFCGNVGCGRCYPQFARPKGGWHKALAAEARVSL